MAQKKENRKKGVKRRKFLKYSGIGVGLMVGGAFLTRHAWRRKLYVTGEKLILPYIGSTKPDIWIQVKSDNQVILHSSKVEMGQGTFTSLAQLVAEELEVPMSMLKVVHAQTDSGNIDQFSTGGSMSIPSLWKPLREMAATTREMLKLKAAEKMKVDVTQIEMTDGKATSGNLSLTYGEIVDGVEEWDFPDAPKLKDHSEFKIIGKGYARVDLEDKVVGNPIFGIDATMENMLYASVVRPRLVDSEMKNFDVSAAENMPGVIQVVQEKDFIGVIANSYVEANNARKKIKFDYEPNRSWSLAEVEEMITVGNGDKTVIQKEGKAVADVDEEGEVMELEFRSPIGAHAQMEPNGAVASYKDGKVTVKMSTQVVALTQKSVAKALGISSNDVNIIPTFLGGGFGRRLHTPNAIQAAKMSKACGRPVKCFFDRKQEFQNDTFRPPTHHVMRGKISPSGELLAIEHNFSSGDVMFNSPLVPSIAGSVVGADIGAIRGGSIMYRNIPHHRAVTYHTSLPFATSFWRSLGLLANTFAIESMMDELAMKAGKDPIQFRLDYIPNDEEGIRLKNVISACAEKAGYQDQAQGDRAMGFAASVDAGSPCAHVAEVSIVDGEIRVHKVTVAFDCGIAVNPDQVRAQVEGCVIMGISASMHEKMDLRDNKLYPVNYGSYKMAMMKHSPREIDTVLIEGVDFAGPVGEPPLGPIAAAIGNAVKRLTGTRLTELPLSLA